MDNVERAVQCRASGRRQAGAPHTVVSVTDATSVCGEEQHALYAV